MAGPLAYPWETAPTDPLTASGANRTTMAYPWEIQSANVSPNFVATSIATFQTLTDLLSVVAPSDGVQAVTGGDTAVGDGSGATYVYSAADAGAVVRPTSGRPVGQTVGAWRQTSSSGAATQLAGEVTGLAGNAVLAKFKGATVPSVAAVAGQVVRATSPTALEFATPDDTVANLAALGNVTAVAGVTKTLAGYSTAGDGGGGQFVLVPGSTATVDGGTVHAVAGGRAIRVYSGALNVRWFGAFTGSGNVATCATAINAALTAAAAVSCPTVHVPAGDHYMNATIVIPSNVALEGAGREATRLVLHSTAALGEGMVSNTNYSLGNNTTDSHVAVRSLTIDGASALSPASGQPRGVFFNKTTHAVVGDCYIKNTQAEGIRIDNTIAPAGTPPTARNNVVRGNIVDRAGLSSDNIMIRSYTADSTNTTQVASNTLDTLVEGNETIGGQHGIVLFNVVGFRVASNDCRDNSQRGIIMGPDATDGVIIGNRVQGAGSTGIHGAYRTKRVTVTGNTVRGTVADGSGIGQEGQGIKFYAAFAGLTITGNTCESCATDGIALEGGAPPVTGGDGGGFVISGNSCIANLRHGIHVRAGTVGATPLVSSAIHTGSISGNVCLGNISNGIHVTTNDVATKPENIAITGNATKDNTGWGLFADNLLNSNIGHNQHATNTGGAESIAFAGVADKQISHHIGIARVTCAAAAPVAGAWGLGDIVYNTGPAPGGTIGWVCTAAGTPGTWKTFGVIAV